MMDFSLLILLIASIHLSLGIPEARASWGEPKEFDRSGRDDNTIGGYDLRRGPVFYEAYYPSLIDADSQLMNSRNDEKIDAEKRSLEGAYQVARELERFAKALETNTEELNNYSERDIRGYRYPPVITDYEREFIKDYTNIILSAVTRQAMKIEADNNNNNNNNNNRQSKNDDNKMINELSRQQRFVDTSNSNDRNDPVNEMELHRKEKIFQPRPQIINYIFSAKDKPIEREKLKNISEEGKKNGIASIEVVSEVPARHKIRHHHGEKIKRNR